jgi:DNA-binding LytR/AlgR family response regulator
MPYRCYLVDDEPIALDILANYLGRLEGYTVAGRFTNPIKAFESLHQEPVDLLFLDIHMPGLTGLELLAALRRPPACIITTAYREFALEGFNLDVVDYLLKPVAFERFLQAIDKFQSRRSAGPAPTLPRPAVTASSGEDAHVFVRADRRNVKVLLDDILYLESLKDYVRIVTTTGKILTKDTLGHFEELLPAGQFLRVHRSFIVARNKIKAQSADGLELGAALIPVGRLYKLAVERELYGKK